jgi:hypothetical protein
LGLADLAADSQESQCRHGERRFGGKLDDIFNHNSSFLPHY